MTLGFRVRTRRALTCFSPDHDPRLLPAGPSAVPRARSHAHRPAGCTRPRASPEGARLPAPPPRGSALAAAPPVPAEGRRDRSTASASGPGPVNPQRGAPRTWRPRAAATLGKGSDRDGASPGLATSGRWAEWAGEGGAGGGEG